jgi:glutathione synthase/RimK-type ligase-like ATP-grasp enzyme
MILIITHKEDFTADFVIEKLNEQNISYFRLNCEDLNENNYMFDDSNNFNFSINGISEFSSVWFRRTKLPNIETTDQSQKIFLLADYESLFDNLFNLINTKKWLSQPNHIYKAENKLYQLQKAKQIGFNIPNTIVTNCYKKLSSFIHDNDKNVIIKPIRQGRIQLLDGVRTIFTNQVTQAVLENLTHYDLTPCIVQNNVSKDYEIRITIVGDKVFSAKINSQENENTQTDWRKEKTPFSEYKLPIDIHDKCIILLKELNISFGAIDMIKDKNGKYIFLEINPNGQWAWIEMETGLKISEAIIDYLKPTE